MPEFLGTDDNDLLFGTEGADRMVGFYGDDSYILNNRGDVVIELFDEGDDWLLTTLPKTVVPQNVEITVMGRGARTLIGNDDTDLGNILIGNDNKNIINGKGGFDYIYGAGGADKLTGGDGEDFFEYSAVFESPTGKKTIDKITDFDGLEGDRLVLHELGVTSFLGDTAFSGYPGELRFDHGKLEFDQDGNGIADLTVSMGRATITEDYLLW